MAKTSSLAMPSAIVDPVIEYRRGLRPALAERLEIEPLPEDRRTGEIDQDIERRRARCADFRKQIESETAALKELNERYRNSLLSDRRQAEQTKASILTADDAITILARQAMTEEEEIRKLEAETAQIQADRQRQQLSNEIAKLVNGRKEKAQEIMDRIIDELPELRDEVYRPLRERSMDQSLPEMERARLARAADQIQGVWREYIHRQLDGSERTRCYDFLNHWTNNPTI